LIVQALTSALYGFVNNLLEMLFINALNGIVRPTTHTIGYALAADMIPKAQRGELFGVYNAVWTLSFGSSPTAVGGVFATWRQNEYLSGGFTPGFAAVQAIVDTFFLSTGLVVLGTFIFGVTIREPERKIREPIVVREEEEVAIMDTLD
ncbi:MAG: hypothetical protein ACFFD8_06145, partial [Candidatus Thorarchaeota archaeon]